MRKHSASRLLKTWEKSSKPDDEYDNLEYITRWVDSLLSALKKSGRDDEFVTDLLVGSGRFFIDRFSDEEKADAFIYLLGKSRK